MNEAKKPDADLQIEKPKSLSKAVAEGIKEAILNGTFRPGDKLVETTLTERLGVSRTPLREAFRELEVEGYITVIPHKGAFVSQLSEKEVRDIYTIASVLESLAARLATPHMVGEKLAKLKEMHSELKRCLEKRDIDGYYAVNALYHHFIAETSRNERLCTMIDSLRKQILKTRALSLALPERLDASMSEHDGLLKAFTEGDALLVEKLMMEHFANQGMAFIQMLKEEA